MSKIQTADTRPEIIVRKKLHSLGLRFRVHNDVLPGKPDIVLPKHRLIIFVHGCFWHHHDGCKKSRLPASNAEFWRDKILANVDRDKRQIAELEQLGWRVAVVWECEAKKAGLTDKLIDIVRGNNIA